MPDSRITDFRLRKFRDDKVLRAELFSFVPKKRMLGMDARALMDVLDAYGRSDLAARALQGMEIPVPTSEPSTNGPVMLKVVVVDESYRVLYEWDAEDRFTRRGELSEEAARELFGKLSA